MLTINPLQPRIPAFHFITIETSSTLRFTFANTFPDLPTRPQLPLRTPGNHPPNHQSTLIHRHPLPYPHPLALPRPCIHHLRLGRLLHLFFP